MKEDVAKVIDRLTQEDYDEVFQKLLERYNKCITAAGDYFEEDKSYMWVLSTKVPIRKESGNFFNEPRMWTCPLISDYHHLEWSLLFKKNTWTPFCLH